MSEEYKNFNGYEPAAEETEKTEVQTEVVKAEVVGADTAASSGKKGIAKAIIGAVLGAVATEFPSFYFTLRGFNPTEYLSEMISGNNANTTQMVIDAYKLTPGFIAALVGAFICSLLGIIFCGKSIKGGKGARKIIGIIGLVISISSIALTVLLGLCAAGLQLLQ